VKDGCPARVRCAASFSATSTADLLEEFPLTKNQKNKETNMIRRIPEFFGFSGVEVSEGRLADTGPLRGIVLGD
jgi:hypothetical protein